MRNHVLRDIWKAECDHCSPHQAAKSDIDMHIERVIMMQKLLMILTSSIFTKSLSWLQFSFHLMHIIYTLAKTRARTGKALMLPNEEWHCINVISKVY